MSRFLQIFRTVKEKFGTLALRAMAVILLGSIFFVAVGGVSHNAHFKIKKIEVSGQSAVSGDDILAFAQEKLLGNYFFVYARENSLIFPRRGIEDGLLLKFPRLKSARATANDMNIVLVEVSERKPFALWCGEIYNREMYELNDCWFIDKTGFVFDRAPSFSQGVYLEVYGTLENVSGDGQFLRSHLPMERFSRVLSFQDGLRVHGIEVLRIFINPQGEYGVVVGPHANYRELSGVEIRFKEEQETDALLKNLLVALPVQLSEGATIKKKLKYVDLRFGNKVFFGFEN